MIGIAEQSTAIGSVPDPGSLITAAGNAMFLVRRPRHRSDCVRMAGIGGGVIAPGRSIPDLHSHISRCRGDISTVARAGNPQHAVMMPAIGVEEGARRYGGAARLHGGRRRRRLDLSMHG